MKTPLTSIQGFAQAILDGTAGSPAEAKQAAQVIYDESARMHRMVLDLLDLAQLDAGTAEITMAPVNMTALLKAVTEDLLQRRCGDHAGGRPEFSSNTGRWRQTLAGVYQSR